MNTLGGLRPVLIAKPAILEGTDDDVIFPVAMKRSKLSPTHDPEILLSKPSAKVRTNMSKCTFAMS